MKKIDLLDSIPDEYKKDIQKAVEILKKANVKEIYLFGSLVNKMEHKTSDIDIAVVGLKTGEFYKVHGKLMMALEHDFDLIKLDDKKSRFAKFIKDNEELLKIA